LENNNEALMVEAPKNFSVIEADAFRIKLYNLIKEGNKKFVIDFSKCEFLDSTGLGVLIGVYKKCMEINGSISLCRLNDDVLKVFKLTRLDRVFDIIQ